MIKRLIDEIETGPGSVFQVRQHLPVGFCVTRNGRDVYYCDTKLEALDIKAYLEGQQPKELPCLPPVTPRPQTPEERRRDWELLFGE